MAFRVRTAGRTDVAEFFLLSGSQPTLRQLSIPIHVFGSGISGSNRRHSAWEASARNVHHVRRFRPSRFSAGSARGQRPRSPPCSPGWRAFFYPFSTRPRAGRWPSVPHPPRRPRRGEAAQRGRGRRSPRSQCGNSLQTLRPRRTGPLPYPEHDQDRPCRPHGVHHEGAAWRSLKLWVRCDRNNTQQYRSPGQVPICLVVPRVSACQSPPSGPTAGNRRRCGKPPKSGSPRMPPTTCPHEGRVRFSTHVCSGLGAGGSQQGTGGLSVQP